MEGRAPPPKASHPFPNNPDLTKFWGTRLATGYFKSFAVFCLVYGSILGINFYFTRHETGFMGFEMNAETARKRLELALQTSELRRHKLNIHFSHDEFFPSNKNMLFDDGIRFNPPRDDSNNELAGGV